VKRDEASKRKSSIGTGHLGRLDKMEQAYGSLALMGVSFSDGLKPTVTKWKGLRPKEKV
jgi:hypothetical protein